MIAVEKTKRMPLAELRRYPRNPRKGNVDAIVASLEAHGQYRALVVNARTSEVLAGNHTFMALEKMGAKEALVHLVDVDEDQAARIVLVDNRSNDVAGYDDLELLNLLQSLPDLDGTGYEPDDLDKLLALVDPPQPGADTEPGEPPTDPRTKPGDLYLLGDHRLVCGDSTVATDVSRLMNGRSVADAMWTDPPYGVEYEGKTKRALTIKNDGAEGLAELLREAFALATTALAPSSPVYVAHPAGARSIDFALAFVGAGWRLHQGLVWVKNTIVLGHSDYHYAHKPILYGYTPGDGRPGRGAHAGSRWYGDNSQSSLLAYDKPAASTEHPTGKPVGLVEQCLRNSTKATDAVLDLFAGSGSTLIAAENLSRRCYAMELDPGYCDVIVDRWERHTGKKATLADGD